MSSLLRTAFTSQRLLAGRSTTLIQGWGSSTPAAQLPSALVVQVRSATKKTGGSVRAPSNPLPKNRGFKVQNGAEVVPGQIILRQKGREFHPGFNVVIGRDFTIHAQTPGRVLIHYDIKNRRRIVSVDDGSLPVLPTKTVLKNIVAQSVDMVKYLGLDFPERLDYVKSIVTEVDRAAKTDVAQQQRTLNSTQGSRKHSLVDITAVDLNRRI